MTTPSPAGKPPGTGTPQTVTGLHGEQLVVGVDDSRRVMTYLVVRESDDYLAVMDVLEGSVTDLTPGEVTTTLRTLGKALDSKTVETRLDALRTWGAVSARTDTSRAERYADLLARNWRYTATPAGRQTQRFYRDVLAGTPTLREIPLSSLSRVVTALEALAADMADGLGTLTNSPDTVERIGALFTSHDDLDGALVGAEDALAGLADRFDLDDDRTAELKSLLVDYATRVATELESGSARAARALTTLQPQFAVLAELAVASSQARSLIERGALTASRGGRLTDWKGLRTWFDSRHGRAARFSLRLVRSLPGMHANLRRLHTSTGTVSSRSRALLFARAAADPQLGAQIWQAALGDHPWRKLHGAAEDEDLARLPTWRSGPQVTVPELLRSTGRTGPRGKGGAARDDRQARADVAAARRARQERHNVALREVLTAVPGAPLSEDAAQVALASLMAAVRAGATGAVRTASRDTLSCSLVHTGVGVGVLRAPSWQVQLPGRHPLFHLPGQRPSAVSLAAVADSARPDPTPAQRAPMTATTAGSGPRPRTPDSAGGPGPLDRAEGAA